jgi:hypothetical protein
MIQTRDNPAIEAAAKALWEHVTTEMGDTSPWADERDRANQRVAELEDELRRLRSVPEIGGTRPKTDTADV